MKRTVPRVRNRRKAELGSIGAPLVGVYGFIVAANTTTSMTLTAVLIDKTTADAVVFEAFGQVGLRPDLIPVFSGKIDSVAVDVIEVEIMSGSNIRITLDGVASDAVDIALAGAQEALTASNGMVNSTGYFTVSV